MLRYRHAFRLIRSSYQLSSRIHTGVTLQNPDVLPQPREGRAHHGEVYWSIPAAPHASGSLDVASYFPWIPMDFHTSNLPKSGEGRWSGCVSAASIWRSNIDHALVDRSHCLGSDYKTIQSSRRRASKEGNSRIMALVFFCYLMLYLCRSVFSGVKGHAAPEYLAAASEVGEKEVFHCNELPIVSGGVFTDGRRLLAGPQG